MFYASRRARDPDPIQLARRRMAGSVPAGIKSSHLPHPFLFPHQKSTGAQPRLLASSTAFSCQSPTGGVGPANNSPVRKLISRWVVFSDGDGISVSILGSTYLLAARHSSETQFLRCASFSFSWLPALRLRVSVLASPFACADEVLVAVGETRETCKR